MHAVVVRVDINDVDAAEKLLQEQVVPRVSGSPGFVAGYWTRSEDDSNGMSMIVFESEEAARAVADQISPMRDEAVGMRDVEVREVVANA